MRLVLKSLTDEFYYSRRELEIPLSDLRKNQQTNLINKVFLMLAVKFNYFRCAIEMKLNFIRARNISRKRNYTFPSSLTYLIHLKLKTFLGHSVLVQLNARLKE